MLDFISDADTLKKRNSQVCNFVRSSQIPCVGETGRRSPPGLGVPFPLQPVCSTCMKCEAFQMKASIQWHMLYNYVSDAEHGEAVQWNIGLYKRGEGVYIAKSGLWEERAKEMVAMTYFLSTSPIASFHTEDFMYTTHTVNTDCMYKDKNRAQKRKTVQNSAECI